MCFSPKPSWIIFFSHSGGAQSMEEALCPLLPAQQPSPGLLVSEWRHLPVFCRIFWIMVRKSNRIKQWFRAGHAWPEVGNAE